MKNLLSRLEGFKIDSKKRIFIVLTALLIVYIDSAIIMKLQLRSIKALGPKIIELKRNINILNNELLLMQEFKRNKDKKQAQAQPTELIFEDKVMDLLQDISDLANKHKIKITQVNTPKDTKEQEEVIAGLKLAPVIITLDLSCEYHSLGVFLNELENARYFIELRDMKIKRDPDDYLMQKVNLVLRAYAKKSRRITSQVTNDKS